jgi:hypothetical protein
MIGGFFMNSPNFSNFRQLLDLWDNKKTDFNKKCFMEDNNLVFFFKKDKTLYGASENSRLVFARMKNPEPEDKKWSKDATFSAYNLEEEKPNEIVFSEKDLVKIKVMDQEKAEKELDKKGKKMPSMSDSNDSIEEK